MELTQIELKRKIQEYIDDDYSYGEIRYNTDSKLLISDGDNEVSLVESVLKSVSMLNEVENGMDTKRLNELAENSTGESKNIIKDFILYIQE